jgi:hypothetical protein
MKHASATCLRSAAIFAGVLAFAACGVEVASKDDDALNLPQRGPGDGSSTADAPNGGDAPAVLEGATGDVTSGADGADAADAASSSCGTIDGSAVYCIRRSETFMTKGTITYPAGYTGNLPAMGLGRGKLGYLPADYPFTCIAAVGIRGVPPPNNTAGGKICEVSFDNTNTAPVTGTATYTVQAFADAAAGTYEIGLTANSGTTIAEPGFYLRVLP